MGLLCTNKGDWNMYNTINEFIEEWNSEGNSTQKLMDALTDSSLKQQVTPNDRTLGRIAWHVVMSIPEMLSAFGLTVDAVQDSDNVPTSAKEIAESFRKISAGA